MLEKDIYANPLRTNKEFIVIGVNQLRLDSSLQLGTFEWFKDKTPVKMIGKSVYIYDITMQADAHAFMAQQYKALAVKHPELSVLAQRENDLAELIRRDLK
jgi:hypothetical protein